MILDFTLLVVVALLGVGLTVIGGFAASDKLGVQLCFLVAGPVLVVGIIWQGIRQIEAQSAGDSAFMAEVNARREDRRLSDAKTDSLFALLGGSVLPAPKPTAPQSTAPQPGSVQQRPATAAKSLLPPANGTLSVTQSDKISTRPDAPHEAEVVVQTNVTFPSLKFAIQCDKPLVDAHATIGGTGGSVGMVVSFGILKEHPNVFVYSYGSSAPPFGPANPLIIDVWSKEPVKCDQVATF